MTAAHTNYSASAWLSMMARPPPTPSAPHPARLGDRLLAASRSATDADAGPGLLPAAKSRTSAQRRTSKTAQHGRRLRHRGVVVHSDGVSELYLGQIRGPADRHRDRRRRANRSREAVCRRGPDVRPRRRPSALGLGYRRSRPRALLARVGATRQGRVMPGPFAASRGRHRRVGAPPSRQPLAEQRALAAGGAVAPLGDRAVLAVSGEDGCRGSTR